MNIEQLKETLKVDEGVVYEIYNDHLGYATFGIGHLVLDSDLEHGQEVGTPQRSAAMWRLEGGCCRRQRFTMVQTSNEQSRKTYVETRGSVRYYHTNEDQGEDRGWFWCHEKQGFFRHSDWNLTKEEMENKYGN
jgi:hypothetical protein